MSSAAIPDSIEPFYGYRFWHLEGDSNGNPVLTSPMATTLWPVGEAMQAICHLQQDRLGSVHTVPSENCTCGIYGLSSLEKTAQYGSGVRATPVPGRVALWGLLLEGPRGYRAERAYPVELWKLPRNFEERRRSLESPYSASFDDDYYGRYERKLTEVAVRYGCSLQAAPRQLWRAVERRMQAAVHADLLTLAAICIEDARGEPLEFECGDDDVLAIKTTATPLAFGLWPGALSYLVEQAKIGLSGGKGNCQLELNDDIRRELIDFTITVERGPYSLVGEIEIAILDRDE